MPARTSQAAGLRSRLTGPLRRFLQHWVDDLSVALFFFVAGSAMKRELVVGEPAGPPSASWRCWATESRRAPQARLLTGTDVL